MDSKVFVLKGSARTEFIEKRSRFIGEVIPVASKDEAEKYIARRRVEHPDATHVIYAFVVGPPKSMSMGMSDCGEPKGTAGKPVLEILKGSGITNAALTVVRYFGGTKLGTGGLVRAYSRAAREALEKVPFERYEVRVPFLLSLPYDLYDPAKRVIESLAGHVVTEDFGTAVDVSGEIARKNARQLEEGIRDISRGGVEVEFIKGEKKI